MVTMGIAPIKVLHNHNHNHNVNMHILVNAVVLPDGSVFTGAVEVTAILPVLIQAVQQTLVEAAILRCQHKHSHDSLQTCYIYIYSSLS